MIKKLIHNQLGLTQTRNLGRLSALLIFTLMLFAGLGQNFVTMSSAREVSFVRDTEIENTIRVLIAPVFQAAGLDAAAVKIYIVNDDSLNAFVTNGQKIFINTGTLRQAERAEEVIGVMAHEVGHITGGHLADMHRNLERAQATSIAGLLLGIPLALATGRGDVAFAASTLGNQIATRGFLSYTRENEQSADQAGLNYLEQAGINPVGLLEFMERVDLASKLYQGANLDRYALTHPLTSERISFLRYQAEKSPYSDRQLPSEKQKIFARMKAKLNGWIDPIELTLRNYPLTDQSDDARYARAIGYMRASQAEKAVAEIDHLLGTYPDDPFYLETKGDILRNQGDLAGAEAAYAKATEILPWAALIQMQLAQTQLEIGGQDQLNQALAHLNQAALYEKQNQQLWRLYATAYGRLGNEGMLALSRAEQFYLQNNKQEAAFHASRALDKLARGSPAALRANDILAFTADAAGKPAGGRPSDGGSGKRP